ncbi:MAG: 2-oxoglutarate dehydrogenase, E2 component, dihydrolipoamide succinyltransferase, partial [Cellulomonadaceae bacterium]|nr:2-oxoglutarate dehydrogenase, E2 component, dihydrolipoamide succinyltransferase [Cellulomonadaceae bacterium]
MAEHVKLPELGESVAEGTVTRWLKAVGDTVAVDEPLLEVSTDKVDTEVPSTAAGTILQLLVSEDDVVAVGATLAIVGDASAAPAPAAPAAPAAPVAEAPAAAPAPAPAAPAASAPSGATAATTRRGTTV